MLRLIDYEQLDADVLNKTNKNVLNNDNWVLTTDSPDCNDHGMAQSQSVPAETWRAWKWSFSWNCPWNWKIDGRQRPPSDGFSLRCCQCIPPNAPCIDAPLFCKQQRQKVVFNFWCCRRLKITNAGKNQLCQTFKAECMGCDYCTILAFGLLGETLLLLLVLLVVLVQIFMLLLLTNSGSC